MSRINLDSPKITLCLTPKAKAKAARCAAARGLSVTQFIEELIAGAQPRKPPEKNLREIIREEIAAAAQRPAGK